MYGAFSDITMRTALAVAALAGGAALSGCDRAARDDAPTASQPATQPALTLLKPDRNTWTTAEAATHLSDDALALSAAIRLVDLAEQDPACVPKPITDAIAERLRLVRLNDTWWALGFAAADERTLHSPVLIAAEGAVERVATGGAEEWARLHIADDPDIFPHVVTLPTRVLIIEDEVQTAIALEPEQSVWFDLRRQDGFPYIALILTRPGKPEEVARYVWDPYELSFFGPQVDRLPTPPGGKFHIALDASQRLEPRGGELPEPIPIEPPTTQPEATPWDDGLVPA
jgi:hypothetical protein